MGVLAVFLITLGAVNSVPAMVAETCTGGVADSLLGGVYTVALYALGFSLLLRRRLSPWLYVGLVPSALIAIWHTKFFLAFVMGYWLHGMGACYAIGRYGVDAYDFPDGREPFLTILWLGLSLLFWAGFLTGVARSLRSRPSRHA